jgi:hypothetical protein
METPFRAGKNAIRKLLSRARKRSRRRRRLLNMQFLERRRLLAPIHWDGGGDGVSWHNAANWVGDMLPGTGDDVFIDVASNPTVVSAK